MKWISLALLLCGCSTKTIIYRYADAGTGSYSTDAAGSMPNGEPTVSPDATAGPSVDAGGAHPVADAAVDPCAGITCNLPPPSTCSNSQTVRTFSAGNCVAGACSYPSTDTACATGSQCQSGACSAVADPCAGVICNNPPSPYCIGSQSAGVYLSPGTCSAGHCSYSIQVQSCANCTGGMCGGPPAVRCFATSSWWECTDCGDLDYSYYQVGTSGGTAYISSLGSGSDYTADALTGPVVDATPYRGGTIRAVGSLRTSNAGGFRYGGGLWLRVDSPSRTLAFDNMENTNPVLGTTAWTQYEIDLPVANSATEIHFGALLYGNGTLWVDKICLSVP